VERGLWNSWRKNADSRAYVIGGRARVAAIAGAALGIFWPSQRFSALAIEAPSSPLISSRRHVAYGDRRREHRAQGLNRWSSGVNR